MNIDLIFLQLQLQLRRACKVALFVTRLLRQFAAKSRFGCGQYYHARTAASVKSDTLPNEQRRSCEDFLRKRKPHLQMAASIVVPALEDIWLAMQLNVRFGEI